MLVPLSSMFFLFISLTILTSPQLRKGFSGFSHEMVIGISAQKCYYCLCLSQQNTSSVRIRIFMSLGHCHILRSQTSIFHNYSALIYSWEHEQISQAEEEREKQQSIPIKMNKEFLLHSDGYRSIMKYIRKFWAWASQNQFLLLAAKNWN